MDYRRFTDTSDLDIKVSDHLIECGPTTWQIRNIAATSIARTVVPFNEPEPRFNDKKPAFEWHLKEVILVAGVVWGLIHFVFVSPKLAVAAALLVVGILVVVAIKDFNTRKHAWDSAKVRVERQWAAWDEMRSHPMVLYSLMLETNAGSKPLLYTLDEGPLVDANNAIKEAMAHKDPGVVFTKTIGTLSIGGENAINNFGSSIYSQSIRDVT